MMSYRVEYNPEQHSRYPTTKRKRSFLMLLFLVALCVVGGQLLLKGELFSYLIPGDPEITKKAFSVMVEKIDSGAPVGEGIFAFCEEIISNAQ